MTNAFLTQSTLPYQLPPFAEIRDEDYLPAFKAGFQEQLEEIREITANPEPADFVNTIEALERSGRVLHRTAIAFFTVSAAHATEAVQLIEQQVMPLMAEHQDAIYLNRALWERVQAVPEAGLEPEALRLLSEYRKAFLRAGADLDDAGQERMRGYNRRLSELSTAFSQRLLADTNARALYVADRGDLAGLGDDDIAAAAAAAREAGHEEGYLLPLVLPTPQPALARLTNRDTRRRLFEASTGRGFTGDNETLSTAAEIASLRAERARLLGFATHAEYVLDSQTAPSLDAVRSMLDRLVPPAVRNAEAEAEQLRQVARREGFELAPWDWAWCSEQVRREKYDVDLAELRPWFELERVLHDGVFRAATRLYGITFEERTDLPGYHPDVRVWEVRNEDGSPLGLFLGDYYARGTKNGGAWMNPVVEQSGLLDSPVVVANNLNISRPADGEPTLLTFDEVNTLFHEFGHALHGLFSNVRYPRFSGTSVPRDFVEYPSQVNEMWMLDPEILAGFARHYRTDEPLPREAVDKVRAAQLWGEGFRTTEYLGATLLDLAWHTLEPGTRVDDAAAFEANALKEAGLGLALVPPRYRTGYFKHIFASGYAAAYYAYIWSEVLDADTVEWFTENGGLLRENGDRFRKLLLSRGNAMDPLEAFREFRGREARIEPLLKRRGLD
ncbi:Peptidyl-dipeptidase dcp [Arthrobacter saudimassiliensis]|uniref:Peptidyl-dipeptidase dcp n=1 Tax=Arthrobacter saudimassiliensis TaxID=1461584 RepID=A0A078MLU2_9MICC|nr:Peptidyl-dipeptidase dcp [Arthrobacter saudimassiliensis]